MQLFQRNRVRITMDKGRGEIEGREGQCEQLRPPLYSLARQQESSQERGGTDNDSNRWQKMLDRRGQSAHGDGWWWWPPQEASVEHAEALARGVPLPMRATSNTEDGCPSCLAHSPAHQLHALPLVCCCQPRLLEVRCLPSPLVPVAATLPAPPVVVTGGSVHGHQNLKPSVGMEALGSNW